VVEKERDGVNRKVEDVLRSCNGKGNDEINGNVDIFYVNTTNERAIIKSMRLFLAEGKRSEYDGL
jgi:hypothetical protein